MAAARAPVRVAVPVPVVTRCCRYCGTKVTRAEVLCVACERALAWARRHVDALFKSELAYTYDRIGRGTLHIRAACVLVLGGIQPGPLEGHCLGRVEAATGGAAELIRPAAAAESAVDRLRGRTR
jgi:hypothetical protein